MDFKPVIVNGYDTYFAECHDKHGDFLLIVVPPHAGNDISDICGTLIFGKMITEIDYVTIDNNRCIKAYY